MPVEMQVSEFTLEELKEFQAFLSNDLRNRPSPLVSRMKDLVEEELKRRQTPLRQRPAYPRLCKRGCGLKD